MARLRLKTGSIVGTFGKGIEGSLTVNFGVSGGDNCDTACKHHPQSSASDATRACYAVRAEIRPDRADYRIVSGDGIEVWHEDRSLHVLPGVPVTMPIDSAD